LVKVIVIWLKGASSSAHFIYVRILADISHTVQQTLARIRVTGAVRFDAARNYCRAGGGFVGQGDGACAGAAVIGAGAGAAAAVGRAAGFFAAGFLAGFFAPGAEPGVSSTTTGLGRSLGGSPVVWITSSLSVPGW
jgi:hypothetical protein